MYILTLKLNYDNKKKQTLNNISEENLQSKHKSQTNQGLMDIERKNDRIGTTPIKKREQHKP